MNENIIYVKLDFIFNTIDENYNSSDNIDKVYFFYSLDGNDWIQIGDEIKMTYDLQLFTGYRFGIYSYPTEKVGGYVDIDSFIYERAIKWNIAD